MRTWPKLKGTQNGLNSIPRCYRTNMQLLLSIVFLIQLICQKCYKSTVVKGTLKSEHFIVAILAKSSAHCLDRITHGVKLSAQRSRASRVRQLICSHYVNNNFGKWIMDYWLFLAKVPLPPARFVEILSETAPRCQTTTQKGYRKSVRNVCISSLKTRLCGHPY